MTSLFSPLWTPPWRIILAMACLNAMFFIPVAILYYGMKGADLGGFLLLQGLFRVAVLVLEVPTGYLADRWSRPAQLRAGAALWVVSMALLFEADSFGGLLLAEMVGALSISLLSGTVQAYLHEALRAEGKAAEEARWQGRLTAVELGAETLAALIGGVLFLTWVEAPTVWTLVCAMLGLLIMMNLPNVPQRQGARRHRNPVHDLGLVIHHSLRVHPRLPWLLLGPFLLFGLTGVLFWALQGQLVALGLTPLGLGVALAAYQGLKALLAAQAYQLAVLPRPWLVSGLVAMLGGGTLLMLTDSLALVWLGGMLAAGVVHAVGKPLFTVAINHEVEDHERATVLSVASMINQSMGAVLLIGAEPLLDHVSLSTLLGVYLAVVLLLAGYPLWRIARDAQEAPATS